MNKKITSSLKYAIILFFLQNLEAQQIYSNGNLSTGAVTGSTITAPATYTWSECQSDAGNTTESNSNAGFGALFTADGTTNMQLADDFVVPVGQVWNISSFNFYAYKTNYAGSTPPIDQLRIQIFNTDPSLPGAVALYGNMTTNVINLAESGEANMYRIFNTTTPSPGTPASTARKIWKYKGNINALLPAGIYWVVFQMHDATDESSGFCPLVTVAGTRGLPGWNAKQNIIAAVGLGIVLGWADVVDAGNPTTAPDVPQDIAFAINGTVTLAVNDNSFEAGISVVPNPVNDVLHISNSTNTAIYSYEIVDLMGKVVKTALLNSTEINVSDLAEGNYILKLKSEQGTATKKIIKQ